jgi:small-conductance mechanosensitive channel
MASGAMRRRWRTVAAIPTVAWVFMLAVPSPAAPASSAAVEVAGRTVFVLDGDFEGRDPVVRAREAADVIARALEDPACGAERIGVDTADGVPFVTACGRRVAAVTAESAAAAGASRDETAASWVRTLRPAFEDARIARASRTLLGRAILGVAIPVLFVAALLVTRLAMRRLRAQLLRVRDVRVGDVDLGATSLLRRAAEGALRVVQWGVYLALTYVFVAVMLDRFGPEAPWRSDLLGPLLGLPGEVGRVAIALAPRLLAALLAIIAARFLLAAVGRLFSRVREGRIRLDPLVSAEDVGPAELTVRGLVVAGTVLLLSLLVPGEAGWILLGAISLAGLSLVLGAREAVRDLLGGILLLYLRPFRTGDRIRICGVEGIVRGKGFLLIRLDTGRGTEVLVPCGAIFDRTVEVLGCLPAIRLRVTVSSPRGTDAAWALFRDAGAEARCVLAAIRDDRLEFEVEWPASPGTRPDEARSSALQALVPRAAALDIRIVEAEPASGAASG